LKVGILVGRRTANKDFILQLVRTPEEEEGQAALRLLDSSSASSSARKIANKISKKIELDNEWIVEHACQLARILPGGLSVLGVYAACPSEPFQNSQAEFVSLIKEINKELPIVIGSKPVHADILIHLDSLKAVLTGKELADSIFKPCNLKNSSLLTDMVEIQCKYDLDLDLDLTDDKQILGDVFQGAINWEVEHRVKPAVPLLLGHVPPSQEQLVDIMHKEGLSFITIDLMKPVSGQGLPTVPHLATKTARPKSGVLSSKGRIHFEGLMECRGYVHRRESISSAVESIKQDIEMSLRARLEILMEAAEMATEAMEKETRSPHAQTKHPLLDTVSKCGSYEPHFPRRAFLKWRLGVCCYCDFIVEGDGLSEALQRIRELVGEGKVEATTFQCKEAARQIHDRPSSRTIKHKKIRSAFAMSSCNIMVLGTVIAATLGIWIAALGIS